MEKIKSLLMLILFFSIRMNSVSAQVLETEESRPLMPGQFEVGTGIEFQTSSEGTETAIPMAIEYGLSRKLTLLVEPVGFTSIYPNTGSQAKGIGDIEITIFYQLMQERKTLPSISVSGEIKIPTASDKMIGTGKVDLTPFIIVSKTTWRFFTSMNLSYTFIGKPKGVNTNNLFNYALGTIFTLSPHSILFGEIYGNTSSFGEAEIPESDITAGNNINIQELSGGEMVRSMGYGYYVKKELLLSLGISYDNNNAILIRPGIEWKFNSKNKLKTN